MGKILDNLDILWTEIVTFDRYKQFGFFRLLVSNTLTEMGKLFPIQLRNLVKT